MKTGITIILSFYLHLRSASDDMNSNLETRIVGGSATTIEEFPYQVSIMYIDTHFCGGSLIHQLYVLTAAHCTDNFRADFLLVRAGSTYLDQGGQVRQVNQIYQHPSYNVIDDVSYDNDIAVLQINSRFDVLHAIVQLPHQDDSVSVGGRGIATGWGKLSETGALPLELQKVELPIINDTLCNSNQMYDGYITGSMLCAGYFEGGKDTCLGDSGGPLVLNGVIIGITSWGDGCARGYRPGVYTRVSKFVNYINEIINK